MWGLTTEDTEPNKPTRNALEAKFQKEQERQNPNKTTPGLQAARDAAVKVLNGWRKGISETNNHEDFETFAARNMVRILKRTARLPENTKKEVQEWSESKTLKQMKGSNSTQLTPPCHSPSGTCTARDQNKANATDVDKILKSDAKLIKKKTLDQRAGRNGKPRPEGSHPGS